jgi:hypothetical protein
MILANYTHPPKGDKHIRDVVRVRVFRHAYPPGFVIVQEVLSGIPLVVLGSELTDVVIVPDENIQDFEI